MSHKLLSANGDVRSVSADEFATLTPIDPSDSVAAFEQLAELLTKGTTEAIAFIEIPSSADGRAFSVIGQLAANSGATQTVWIGGDLLPDQVSLAFQCGAAAMLIDDASWEARGEDDWLSAIKPSVNVGYRPTVWSGVQGISALRG